MAHTVSYPCRHPLVLHPKGNLGTSIVRPWIEVLVTIGTSSHKVFCLVDTGADDTVLDLATAITLGVNHLAPLQVSVTGVGSGATLHSEPNVRLDFAGGTVTVSVLFGSVTVPVLGRRALLDAGHKIEFGFDATAWHHT